MKSKPPTVASLTGLIFLVLCFETPASPLIQILGGSSRTIDIEDVVTANRTIEFGVVVQPIGKQSRVMSELIGFSHDDRVLEFDPNWHSYEMHRERADRAIIRISIPEPQLEESGTYTLTVEFWKLTQPEPEKDGSPAPPATNSDEGSLTLTLIRPAGELTLQGPIRIERVIYIPWKWSDLTPSALLLSETSGRNFVKIKPPNNSNQTMVQLRSSANSETIANLSVTLPNMVGAAQQLPANVELVGVPPIGSLSGTLQIISDQLQPRTLSTAIEVATRVHRSWLIALIFIGIFTGYIVRVVLENGKQRKLAEAAARRVREELKSASHQIVDETYNPLLEKMLSTLSTVLDGKASIEGLNAASVTATNALSDILGKLEADRATLNQKISAAQAELGSPEDYSFDVSGLAEANEFILRARASMQKGSISVTLKSFDSELKKTFDRIVTSLAGLASSLVHEVRLARDWAELDVAKVVDDLREKIKALQEGLSDLNQADQIGSRLREFNFTLRLYKRRYINERAPSIVPLVEGILNELKGLPPCKKLQKVEELETSIAEYQQMIDTAKEADLKELLEKERVLYDVVNATLGQSAQTVGADLSNVAPGNAREKVEMVIKKVGSNPLGGRPKTLAPAILEPIPPDEKNWVVTIETNSEPRAGSPLMLSAKLGAGDSSVQLTTLTTAWRINGVLQPSSGPGGLNCMYTPGQDERELTVELTVNGGPPAHLSVTATTTIRVRPSKDREIAKQLEQEASTISGLQTAMAGAVIVFAGYAIFQSAFVGSFTDISAALFWGFGIDISVAKALEYTTPLTSRKLP